MSSPSEFDAVYLRWRAASFPTGSSRDEVDELHAELAQWEAFVADSVIPVAKGSPRIEGAVDIAAEVEDFIRRLVEYRAVTTAEDRDKVDEYLAYAELLRHVYAAAVEHDLRLYGLE